MMMSHLLMWAEFPWLITQLQNFIDGHFSARTQAPAFDMICIRSF